MLGDPRSQELKRFGVLASFVINEHKTIYTHSQGVVAQSTLDHASWSGGH